MEVNEYKDLMNAIQNLEFEVVEIRNTCIRSLSICLLVYVLGTLGYFGVIVYNYFK